MIAPGGDLSPTPTQRSVPDFINAQQQQFSRLDCGQGRNRVGAGVAGGKLTQTTKMTKMTMAYGL